jgi:hypothetical protein
MQKSFGRAHIAALSSLSQDDIIFRENAVAPRRFVSDHTLPDYPITQLFSPRRIRK